MPKEKEDQRLLQLRIWAEGILGSQGLAISPASADASFRRYFRVRQGDQSWIIMDAPPDKEDSEPFVRISGYLARIGLNVPRVLKSSLEQGFYLLTDLGQRAYLDCLNDSSVDQLYSDAMHALEVMHLSGNQFRENIPPYDRTLLLNEMGLFRDWYLARHHSIELKDKQHTMLESTFDFLAASALEQPEVFVHRDYHSRNLMYLEHNNPGILDFQDAVWGAVSYDLVSLLRDCYIAWPREKVEAWVKQYHQQMVNNSLLQGVSVAQFLRWFDLMGVQRHLKATGIFSRLNYRDDKPGYLNDIPRTMNYVLNVAKDYPELGPFLKLLDDLGITGRLV